MTENIFQKGCLVQMSVSKWGGVKKIDKSKIANMVHRTGADWVTATKKLVDPDSLKPICKINNSARNWLATLSLPFPITGMVFIPKNLINEVDQKLSEFQFRYNEAVQDFVLDYNQLRETARSYLDELFNEVDYPIDIAKKFDFSWRFVILDIPNGEHRILAPEVYAREQEKLFQTMEDFRVLAVEALREEFAFMVERITERFTQTETGKPKVFKNASVDCFFEYFQAFKHRNIFEDDQLSELVNRAQAVLKGSSVDQIRSNDKLKDSIRSGMSDIEHAMHKLFNRPKRKIVMD